MANIVPNSFKANLLKGVFNFDTTGNGGNQFKCALYTAITGYSTSSTVYLSGVGNNEVDTSNTNYSTGGLALNNLGVDGTSATSFIDFGDLTFPSVTLTARGAAIYKSTGGGNELVLVLDFGSNKTATNGDFVIQFPAGNSSNAIIRLGDA
jgi:hypothetical protein|tara:strand:- start:190 stop:642 length:453 start_codon:yes stop_codon:yes gene_type:complete